MTASDTHASAEVKFVQPLHTTLHPYWLWVALSALGFLMLPPLEAAILLSLCVLPRLLLRMNVIVAADRISIGTRLLRTQIRWGDVQSATIGGADWRRHLEVTVSNRSRPLYINIGLLTDLATLATAVASAAGESHPLARELKKASASDASAVGAAGAP